jgi:G3E family GTPase
MADERVADDRIPVMLLTGFLGSGKTTLLNAWLQTDDLSGAAIIVNEFGEIGIDHALIASSNENTIELSTGCLCCTVRGDLVDTLRELQVKRAKGEVRAFDRVVIETTGLADPAPVIQALMTLPVVRRFRLQQVVTTVDCIHGLSTLDQHLESVKQAAAADDIVLTKTDIGTRDIVSLVARLKALNRGVRIHSSSLQEIVLPSAIAVADIYHPATKSEQVLEWLNAEAYTPEEAGRATHHDGRDGVSHEHHHHHDINRHSPEIGSFCLQFDQPLIWDHLAHWLDSLVINHGDDLLRVKGIVNVVGRDKPIVVQAVQRLFHRPFQLAEWPSDDRTSRIVFITRGLSRDFVAAVYETISQKQVSERTSADTTAPISTTSSGE